MMPHESSCMTHGCFFGVALCEKIASENTRMKQVLGDHCTLNFRDRIRKSNRDYSSLNNFFRYEFRRKIRKYLLLMSKL